MSKSRFTRENAFSVGIREPGSRYVPPDTDKDEKDSTHAIDLEVLKAIRTTVLGIKKRIDAGGNFGNDSQECVAGNPSSSKITGPNSGENRKPEAAEDR
jgi:hypothetical protein